MSGKEIEDDGDVTLNPGEAVVTKDEGRPCKRRAVGHNGIGLFVDRGLRLVAAAEGTTMETPASWSRRQRRASRPP